MELGKAHGGALAQGLSQAGGRRAGLSQAYSGYEGGAAPAAEQLPERSAARSWGPRPGAADRGGTQSAALSRATTAVMARCACAATRRRPGPLRHCAGSARKARPGSLQEFGPRALRLRAYLLACGFGERAARIPELRNRAAGEVRRQVHGVPQLRERRASRRAAV